MLCDWVSGSRHFEILLCYHLHGQAVIILGLLDPENEDITIHQKVGNHLPSITAQKTCVFSNIAATTSSPRVLSAAQIKKSRVLLLEANCLATEQVQKHVATRRNFLQKCFVNDVKT
jgi:hypothetical protein